jgi:hypothetical protein
MSIKYDSNTVFSDPSEIGKLVGEVKEAFAANPYKKIEKKPLTEVREETAPESDKPTTVSAKPGETDLPSIQIQIDPSGVSAVFPGAAIQLSSITSLVGSTTQSTRNEILYIALADAFRVLINKYSYDIVINRLDSVFSNGGLDLLSSNIKGIVKKSIAEIIVDVSKYGPDNIPEPEYYQLLETDFEAVPDNIVATTPRLYVQKYYLFENDPFPGYEEWYLEEKTVYVKREIGDFYFESMQEDILGTSTFEIVDYLSPYMENVDLLLSVPMFDAFLIQQEENVKKNGMDKALGSGSGGGGISSMLPQLLGQLSVVVDLQVNVQLPGSVLNNDAVKKTIDAFSENMAMVKKINEMIDQAMQIPNILNNLANIGLSQLTSALNLNNILGSLNIPGLNVNLNGLSFNIEGVNININTPILSDAISKLQNVSNELTNSLNRIQPEFQAPVISAANRLKAIASTQRLSIAIG